MNILDLQNTNNACPVSVGDRFYRKPFPGNIPDLIQVIEIEDIGRGFWIITGKYIYHSIGNNIKKFSSDIFKDERWIIKKKSEMR